MFSSLYFQRPPNSCLYGTNTHHHEISTTHEYAVTERVDLTDLRFLTIDPVGSLDADDAFSVTEHEDGGVTLRIAIADPSHWIDPHSPTLMAVIKNGITNYQTGSPPDNMISDAILESCNLIGDCQAMVVTFYLDSSGSHVKQPEISLARIRIDPEKDKCSYRDTHLLSIPEVQIGLRITEQLSEQRQGIDLTGMNLSTIEKRHGVVTLVQETDTTRKLQKMIAEFAIQTNAWIGCFLHERYEVSIYRICAAPKSLLQKIGTVMDVMDHFVASGVHANYSTSDDAHDMVNRAHYTHFTSPIRRSVDLIIHYLVKSIILDLPEPFTVTELNHLAEYLDPKNRLSRQNGFGHTKLVLCQYLNQETETNAPISIRSRYQGLRGARRNYLNFSIIRVQHHNTRISCSFPIRLFEGAFTDTVDSRLIASPENDLTINHVYTDRKHDNEVLKEIFDWFVGQCE